MNIMSDDAQIRDQVKLPLKIAFDVVMQGIKIRFGRSVVTLTGVVLGIAFLMSIFAGLALKKGVQEEDAKRAEVGRMFNFLVSEMGPPKGRTIGLIAGANMSEAETRLLRKLEDKGLEHARYFNAGSELQQVFDSIEPESVSLEEVFQGVNAVIVSGEVRTGEFNWTELFDGSKQNILALTRNYKDIKAGEKTVVAPLAQEMTEEELQLLEKENTKQRFRNGWIIIISLLVTVMGISNAMLMSVTERFREIGTMKCLGALSSFVRTMFLIESFLLGCVGGILGCLTGLVFSFIAYGITYGFPLVLLSVKTELWMIILYMFLSVIAGIILSTIAAIYPAHVASRMVPADALRSNV